MSPLSFDPLISIPSLQSPVPAVLNILLTPSLFLVNREAEGARGRRQPHRKSSPPLLIDSRASADLLQLNKMTKAYGAAGGAGGMPQGGMPGAGGAPSGGFPGAGAEEPSVEEVD